MENEKLQKVLSYILQTLLGLLILILAFSLFTLLIINIETHHLVSVILSVFAIFILSVIVGKSLFKDV